MSCDFNNRLVVRGSTLEQFKDWLGGKPLSYVCKDSLTKEIPKTEHLWSGKSLEAKDRNDLWDFMLTDQP